MCMSLCVCMIVCVCVWWCVCVVCMGVCVYGERERDGCHFFQRIAQLFEHGSCCLYVELNDLLLRSWEFYLVFAVGR